MDIGKRIKQLRIKNNLTLEELASRCELTKGFLSQLERNLTSPSIVTLEDICEALGITMSKFFEEENDEKIVFKQEDVFVDEKELSITNWIVPNAQKNEMEPIILQLKPTMMELNVFILIRTFLCRFLRSHQAVQKRFTHSFIGIKPQKMCRLCLLMSLMLFIIMS